MRRPFVSALAGAALLLATPTLAAPAGPVKIAKGEAARGVTQVVIGSFNVGFLFESVDSQGGPQMSGLLHAFSGPTKAKSVLEGVTPAMMQAITDAAYADFRAQLATRGYTVVETQAMLDNADFRRIPAKPIASPVEVSVALGKNSKGKTSFYKPTAMPQMLMFASDFTGTGLSSMGLGMQAGYAQAAMTQYAKAANQPVIGVVYLIDFSDAKRPGAFSFSGIKVTSGVSVSRDYSRLNLLAPNGRQATLTVNEAVAVDGDFATMADATGGVNKGMETATNVIGAFAGIGVGKTRKFTFTAKPDAYQEGAIKAATLANARLLDQLAALR